MRRLFERFSGQQEYRLASVVLVAGAMLSVYSLLVIEPTWAFGLLAFAMGAAFYAALVFLTYFRLRDATLSGWWLLPMILVFHIGPRWELRSWEWGHLGFSLSGLISLVPVIIGWFAATRNPEGPVTRGTWSD